MTEQPDPADTFIAAYNATGQTWSGDLAALRAGIGAVRVEAMTPLLAEIDSLINQACEPAPTS